MAKSKSTSTLPRSKITMCGGLSMPGLAPPLFEFPAAFQRAAESEFVGKFQTAAGGQAVGDTGDFHFLRGQSFGQVKTGRVALDVGAKREDDFPNRFLLEALLEFANAEILGFNSVDRRNAPAQDMKFAAVISRFFDADDIDRPFDQTNDGIAPGIGANVTGA